MKKISVSILVRAALTVSLVALFAPDLFAQTYAPRHSTYLTIDGNGNGQKDFTLKLPTSGLTPYSLTLPAAVGGSGYTLVTTDASGTLGWAVLPGTISLNGSPNYLSVTGQAITMNAIDLSNTSNTAANALPISRGGTNSTTTLTGTRPMVSTTTAIVENNAALTNLSLPLWNLGNFATSSLSDNGFTVSTTEDFTMSGAKKMTLGTVSSGTGSLALANGSSTFLTTLQAGSATAAVTYKLPTANGTSGQMLATDGSNPAQLGWTNPVSLTGTANYLSLAGQQITQGAIDLSNTSNTTANALPISRGGTNSATALGGTARPMVSTTTAIVENNATLTNLYLPLWNLGNFANSSLTDDGFNVTTTENIIMSGAKTLRLGTVSSATGSLALANSSSSNLTTIQAGNATAAVTYTMPTAQPTTNQVLTATSVSGSGPYAVGLGWSTGGTGSGGLIMGASGNNNVPSNQTSYINPIDGRGGDENFKSPASMANANVAGFPVALSVKNFRVTLDAALTSTETCTFTLYNLSTSTALSSVTFNSSSGVSVVDTGTYSVAAGNLVTLRTVSTNGASPLFVWGFQVQ